MLVATKCLSCKRFRVGQTRDLTSLMNKCRKQSEIKWEIMEERLAPGVVVRRNVSRCEKFVGRKEEENGAII
jgi:hypothetical protein